MGPGSSVVRSKYLRRIGLALVAAASACGEQPPLLKISAASDAWQAFEGSWSASGTRHTLHLGGDHFASIVNVSGSMVIKGKNRLGVGFRSQSLGLSNDENGFVGHAVWTDERGDQVFSELKGEKVRTGNRITGTITGGTGRYDGVVGDYEFQWQYVIEAEEGTIQGRAIGLKGRFRREAVSPAGNGGARP